ncbi:hypothetical protein IFM12275_14310 [Nocardia sputorum]|nr:hypothetical protein IFM12275_14310 [Nocardia sputorum]
MCRGGAHGPVRLTPDFIAGASLISSAPPIAVDGDNRYNGMSLVDGDTRLHTGRVYARAACVADMRVRRPDHAAFRSALF